jgi:hypothetical protein
MRKGKIVLTAVAFFAVVGGALAFKASRATLQLYYLTTNAQQQTVCIAVPNRTTTDAVSGTVAVPGGGIGWYTTSKCDINETFKARATTD